MSAGEKKSRAKTIANITASAPCSFATRKGIKIGDGESAASKAYAEHVDRETKADPGILVVGSMYGGIIFNFTKGKVSRIFFGAAAE
jgi:chorismate synthase